MDSGESDLDTLSIYEKKQKIRNIIAQHCADIPNKESQDIRIQKKLYDYIDSLCTIRHIFSYRALNDEVDLSPLHQRWFASGISIYLAKTASTPPIAFDPTPPHFLSIGYDSCLCIVPGRAFTRDGRRIGRGMGIYDRFLSTHPQLKTVSVAYGFQIVDSIPSATYDCDIDNIIA